METLTTEEQIEHLRGLLAESEGHHRHVVRPVAFVGIKTDPVSGQRFKEPGPGPLTIVTFYISHGSDYLPDVD